MSRKNRIQRRLWRWSLMAHSAFFVLGWALALYILAFFAPYQSDRTIPLLLVMWMPVFIAHLIAYYRHTSHPNAVELERQAYREGFADGMRDRGRLDDPYDARRLAIDDEGELIEDMPQSNKRKREWR